jgi:hypothetical protein
MTSLKPFRSGTLLLLAFAAPLLAAPQTGYRDATQVFGPSFSLPQQPVQNKKLPPPQAASACELIRHWNSVAIDASGLDHTPVQPGETRLFGEQLGPHRASRAMAIVHIAIYDAVNAIDGSCKSYTGLPAASPGTSMECAIMQAAHDTLCALFPSQKNSFDPILTSELNAVKGGKDQINKGIALGKASAAACLTLRANDNSNIAEPRLGTDPSINFVTSNDPGKWRQDPISQGPLALGAYWGQVKPFVLQSASQFRAPVPPALNSAEYAAAYNEAKNYGGDGIITPTLRTTEQTKIGTYWAYDGTPSLCAPPRLYNQLIMHIADQMGTSSNPMALCRLLAVANTAMADTAIAIWESKFFYQYWRPVTAIRESDAGTGPSGLGDGNDNTAEDLNFTPLGAPASNLNGPNFTPPFPSYPSGHGGFGGALFEILRKFYGTDDVSFTFTSDEFNGITKDNGGNVRPLLPRSFCNFSQAEEENGQSRIYLGIHWAFDKTEAIIEGRRVADYVFANAFTPLPKKGK